VTWNWFPSFRGSRKNSWVCSGLSCESLRFGGWFHNWTGIYTIFPQQAYDALMSDGWSVELSS